MQSRQINPVNLVRETLGKTGSVYIPSLIISLIGLLTTFVPLLLSNLPLIGPILSIILYIILAIFLTTLLAGANIFYLHRHFSCNYINIGEALNLSFKNIFKLLWASFFVSLISFTVVFLIFVVRSILLFFASYILTILFFPRYITLILLVITVFYIMLRLSLFLYAIVIEDFFAPYDGITRSWQLTKCHFWSIFLSTLLLTIVLLFPIITLYFISSFSGIPQQISSIVGNIIGFSISPFFNVYGYLLYVNLKEDYNERLSNRQLNH